MSGYKVTDSPSVRAVDLGRLAAQPDTFVQQFQFAQRQARRESLRTQEPASASELEVGNASKELDVGAIHQQAIEAAANASALTHVHAPIHVLRQLATRFLAPQDN